MPAKQLLVDGEVTTSLLWTCPKCTLNNAATRKRCGACESRRPVENTAQQEIESPESGVGRVRSRKRKRDAKMDHSPLAKDHRIITVHVSLCGCESSSLKPLKAALPRELMSQSFRLSCKASMDLKEEEVVTNSSTEPSPTTDGSTVIDDLIAHSTSSSPKPPVNEISTGTSSNALLALLSSADFVTKIDTPSPKALCGDDHRNPTMQKSEDSYIGSSKIHLCDNDRGHSSQRKDFNNFEPVASQPSSAANIGKSPNTKPASTQSDPAESWRLHSQQAGYFERMTQQDGGFMYTPASIPSRERKKFRRTSPQSFSKSLLTTVDSPQRLDTKNQILGIPKEQCVSNVVNDLGPPSPRDPIVLNHGIYSSQAANVFQRHKEIFYLHPKENLPPNCQLDSTSEHLKVMSTASKALSGTQRGEINRSGAFPDATGKLVTPDQGKPIATARQQTPIDISEESRAKLDELTEVPPSNFGGFLTAGSRRAVHVSDESLKRASALLTFGGQSTENSSMPRYLIDLGRPTTFDFEPLKPRSTACRSIAEKSIKPTLLADDARALPTFGTAFRHSKTEAVRKSLDVVAQTGFCTPAGKKEIGNHFQNSTAGDADPFESYPQRNANPTEPSPAPHVPRRETAAASLEITGSSSWGKSSDTVYDAAKLQSRTRSSDETNACCYEAPAIKRVSQHLQNRVAFHSAGKKKEIVVSDDAMAIAYAVCNAGVLDVSNDRKMAGYKQSTGKAASYSGRTSGRASYISLKPDDTVSNERMHAAASGATGLTMSSGFHLAGQKKDIKVSESSMAKVPSQCADIIFTGESHGLSQHNDLVLSNKKVATSRGSGLTFHSGFHSAGKKREITVSEDSMTKAAKLCGDVLGTSHGSGKCRGSAVPNAGTVRTSGFCGITFPSGFRSAGNRREITVSAEDMAKASSLYSGITTSGVSHSPILCNGIFLSSRTKASGGNGSTSLARLCCAGEQREITVREESTEKVDSQEIPPTTAPACSLISAHEHQKNDISRERMGTTSSGCESQSEKVLGITHPSVRHNLNSVDTGLAHKTIGLPGSAVSICRSPLDINMDNLKANFQHESGILGVPSSAFFLALKTGKMSENQRVCAEDGVPEITIRVNSMNATSVRFHKESGLPCAFSQDRGINSESQGTTRDVALSLRQLGCNSPLLTSQWIGNHSRWIIWKLAAVERRFSKFLARRYLTYNHLLAQLMRRYDREIVRGKRSALRRILNMDASPSFPIILCVAQIFESRDVTREAATLPQFKLELTDGWYSVQATLDVFLCQMVQKGKIQQGTKLMTCDAKLDGLEEGLDPLETRYCPMRGSSDVFLRLVSNGTRLAKWNAKLGFLPPTKRMIAQQGKVLTRRISDIVPGGGTIPLIDFIVSRRYPQLFLEQPGIEREPKSGIKTIVLTEAEHSARLKVVEREKERMMEKALEEVRQECETVVDELAPQTWRLITESESPERTYQSLDDSEKSSFDGWKRKRESLLQDRIKKAISTRITEGDSCVRACVPFIRLLVKTTNCLKREQLEEAVLTVWQPTDDQLEILQEGNIVRTRELSTRPDRYDGMLQLTASSRTLMELQSTAPPSSGGSGYFRRRFANLFRITCASKKLLQMEQPPVRRIEFDTAGIVVKAFENPPPVDRRVYVTDESGLVLRIQFESPFSDAEAPPISAVVGSKRLTIALYRDLRLLPFDATDLCAVAVYTKSSSRSLSPKNKRTEQLMSWASSNEGQRKLQYILACRHVELPHLETLETGKRVAYGYVAGFFVPQPRLLQITVDCNADQFQNWDFPISLMKETLEACCGSAVALNADGEASAAQLKLLGDIFRARGVLLRFQLRQVRSTDKEDGCIYEVCHVTKANLEALASLHLALFRELAQRQAPHENIIS